MLNGNTYEDIRRVAARWLSVDPDPTSRKRIEAMLDEDDRLQLHAHFGQRLQFGTAGMRGIRGPGPNRMNRLLARLTTRALVEVLREDVPDAVDRGVVVGFDARHLSRELAEDTVGVLIGLGIPVAFICYPAPTPLIPFTVRERAAAAGIVLTASHNPPEYNGYKVYWENGAPIVPPIDSQISAALDRLPLDQPVFCPEPAAVTASELFESLDHSAGERYLDVCLPATASEAASSLPIVYTPLHGVAGDLALRALARRGFCNVSTVKEQQRPDGDFPTIDYPNPEDPKTLDMALEQAQRASADLILANDPDGDRLAAVVRHDGNLVILTGDQIGWLLGDYLLERHKNELTADTFVIATLVSSSLLKHIAASYGVRFEETLTGLKWVWHRALQLEQQGGRFLFGYEESIGYSVSSAVRDKDGITAAVLFAELAAAEKAAGSSVMQRLAALYERAGYAQTRTLNIAFTSDAHRAALDQRLVDLCRTPPSRVGQLALVALKDYRNRCRTELQSGEQSTLDMPSSNLLQLELEGGSRINLRPSGTEPKFKIYLESYTPPAEIDSLPDTQRNASEAIDSFESAIRELLDV